MSAVNTSTDTAGTETSGTATEVSAEATAEDTVETGVHAAADRARTASRRLARATRAWKDRGLLEIARNIVAKRDLVLAANAKDVAAGRDKGTSPALLDRLTLTPERIDALAAALAMLAGLPDPVGSVARGQTLPNGLRLRQVHVPMGVVAAIYEARPNVTVDIAGLALKSGCCAAAAPQRTPMPSWWTSSAIPSTPWAFPPTPCRALTPTDAPAPTC
jgi:glutamate-5-semialdehyde dehydrogenase